MASLLAVYSSSRVGEQLTLSVGHPSVMAPLVQLSRLLKRSLQRGVHDRWCPSSLGTIQWGWVRGGASSSSAVARFRLAHMFNRCVYAGLVSSPGSSCGLGSVDFRATRVAHQSVRDGGSGVGPAGVSTISPGVSCCASDRQHFCCVPPQQAGRSALPLSFGSSRQHPDLVSLGRDCHLGTTCTRLPKCLSGRTQRRGVG